MNISRNEPWTVLNQLQRHLNQYFDGDPTANSTQPKRIKVAVDT